MELPGLRFLGLTLDLANTANVFAIQTVASNIIQTRRLLKIDFNNVRDVVINGVTYSVPRDVFVTINNYIPSGEYITFPNGRNAAEAFAADVSFPLRYFAVSGSSSADYAARKFFLDSNQYAFFSYAEGTYSARLDYSGSLVEAPLINGLSGVPTSFDPSNATTVKKYRDFFRDYGSHIVHSVNYGARYALQVSASNDHQAVNRMFNANVKALFNGIPSGGDFDASVKTQDQYKIFLQYFQYLVSISGGGDKMKLLSTSGTYSDFQTWIKSIKENDPSLISLHVVEVWTLMRFAESAVLKSYADPLYAAFMWIVGNPNVHESLDNQPDGVEDIPIAVQ